MFQQPGKLETRFETNKKRKRKGKLVKPQWKRHSERWQVTRNKNVGHPRPLSWCLCCWTCLKIRTILLLSQRIFKCMYSCARTLLWWEVWSKLFKLTRTFFFFWSGTLSSPAASHPRIPSFVFSRPHCPSRDPSFKSNLTSSTLHPNWRGRAGYLSN